MVKRKFEFGVYHKIQFYVLIPCLFLITTSLSTNKIVDDSKKLHMVLGLCIDEEIEKVVPEKIMKKESVFILITEKTCLNCYSKLAEYFRIRYSKYNINFIIVIPEDIMYIYNKRAFIFNYYGSFDAAYFLYNNLINDIDNIDIKEILNNPSPAFFLQNEKAVKFFNYERTMKLIE